MTTPRRGADLEPDAIDTLVEPILLRPVILRQLISQILAQRGINVRPNPSVSPAFGPPPATPKSAFKEMAPS